MGERERHLAQVDRQFVRGEITVAEYTAEYDKHPRDYIAMAQDLVEARRREQRMAKRLWDGAARQDARFWGPILYAAYQDVGGPINQPSWYRRAWDAVVRLVRWR